MKKIIIIVVFISVNSSFSQWYQSNWPVDDPTDFFFKDSLSGLLIGYGNAYKTSDGGVSWFVVDDLTRFLSAKLYFITNSIGFGYSYRISKTTNMGDSWKDVTPDGYHAFSNMYFVDDTTGYIVGVDGEIYITNDQGETWEDISYEIGDGIYLYSIYFSDQSNGWIHGSEIGGYYFKLLTSDKGQSWERVWFLPVITKKQFISRDLGYGLTRGRGRLYKSVDAGESWFEITMPHEYYSGQIKDIHFINENIGFACGGVVDPAPYLMGRIYKTIDGGQSWESIYGTNVNSSVTNIFFLNENNGWGISSLGLLRTNYGGITSVKTPSVNIGINFNLFPCYPNPFNPSTTIEYIIEKPSFVKIIIYDVMGREVNTILDEYKNGGSYQIVFNGKDLPSGVYYYSLTTENNYQVKSMILLK